MLYAWRAPARNGLELAEGQHVGIGPMSCAGIFFLVSRARELIPRALRESRRGGPDVPDIVGDAPHIGVTLELAGFVEGRGAGREAQNDGPSGLSDCFGEHANVRAFVRMAGDAVNL